MMRRRSRSRALTALAAVLAAVTIVPAAGAVSGELRVLYVLTTWGPVPFTHAELEQIAAGTDAFFRSSSSNRLSMPGTATGPLRLPRSVFDSCDATVLRNAAPGSTFAGYDRIAFVTPSIATCQFAGEANPTEVLLNGQLSTPLAVHELGHTLGLAHASRWDCVGGRCEVDEYGSSFSVMGGGGGDFNAYEKDSLEWLSGVVRPQGNATHEIGSIEGPTALPQAFVVTTAGSEFWFESRGSPTPSFLGDSEQPPGVAVTAGPSNAALASPYPRKNLLLANPAGGPRYGYGAGESFVQPGVFRVLVERHAPQSAALRFEWLDRVAPSRPRLQAQATRRGRVRLSWDPPLERGSGVQTYTVIADGRMVRSFNAELLYLHTGTTIRLSRGPHRVGMFATDRAGNRGHAASVRVRVKQ